MGLARRAQGARRRRCLCASLTARSGAPANDIVSEVLREVQEFSAGAQSDDLTLLVAREHS
jgi:serine phosphatase RsbU (regulator of sigma subunit)